MTTTSSIQDQSSTTPAARDTPWGRWLGRETHETTNQAPLVLDYDAAADQPLLEGLRREGAGWYENDLRNLGQRAGSQEAQEWGRLANRYEPELRTHDRRGYRIDEVEFHPAWHQLMNVAITEGLGGAAWAENRVGAHVARTAGDYVWQHTDSGHSCPVIMQYAVIPTLRHNPSLAAVYEPLLTNRAYDPGLRVPSSKRGILAAMGMTEKQGGSDVRANTTDAKPIGEDDMYVLRGHKWFTSAPMCDMIFVLAQAPGGLSCFMVPRILPDGTRNPFKIQRLKDKLGNRSNASSEPELDDVVGWLVGEEGRGVKTIIEMVNGTRLWCVSGSASLMRQALVHATHNARHRTAFGATLIDKPLMQNVLADLAIESEAATTLSMRLAGAADRAYSGDRSEANFQRIATALAKYWVPKRTPGMVVEAMECLGGNGYIEESVMPRLYREAPLNAIWEGAGNVQALDVRRALHKDPLTLEALSHELDQARGSDACFDTYATEALNMLNSADEGLARRSVEHAVLALQTSLLLRHAPSYVADAFVATRLTGEGGMTYGTLPATVEAKKILTRATGDTL